MESAAGLLVIPDGGFAGDGLDATHARRNATLIHDLQEPDIAGAMYVRSAAELLAEIRNAYYAYLVAVLFTKQSHGACSDSLVERHDLGFNLNVAQDLLIDQSLDG